MPTGNQKAGLDQGAVDHRQGINLERIAWMLIIKINQIKRMIKKANKVEVVLQVKG